MYQEKMIGMPKEGFSLQKSYSSKKQLCVVLVVIIMPRNRGRGGGRLRVTDNTAVTIGANLQ